MQDKIILRGQNYTPTLLLSEKDGEVETTIILLTRQGY